MSREWPTRVVTSSGSHDLDDPVVVEEPLEIQLRISEVGESKGFSVTMRTPGHDEDLVIGLLYAEGLIRGPHEVVEFRRVGESEGEKNILEVVLAREESLDFSLLARHLITNSACGVCSKSAVDAVMSQALPPLHDRRVMSQEILREAATDFQGRLPLYEQTGGNHGAAIYRGDGRFLLSREDVGRHNAVDKVIGGALRQDLGPLSNHALVVSGRLGYEIVHKVLRAGIPILAGFGAPTSLSIRLAHRGGLTLVGFLSGERMNIYTGLNRLQL